MRSTWRCCASHDARAAAVSTATIPPSHTSTMSSNNSSKNGSRGEATVARPRHSAANYVAPPPKIQLLVRFSRFYNTRIPMGVREFAFMGPMMLAMTALAYFAPDYLPMDKFTQGLRPSTDDMRSYVLEPLYDEQGSLRGYRRVHTHPHTGPGGDDDDTNGTMRLTIDLVRRAPQFTNTLQQREIDLRGLSLSMLDEATLVLLENDFDVVNLTANALTTLEYFPVARGTASATTTTTSTADVMRSSSSSLAHTPVMDRVVTLIVHRNQLHKVSVASCALALPSLRHFLADRNAFATVKSLYFLSYWRALEVVSLEGCPVWEGNPEHYDAATLRAFLVYMCPSLKLINYERVTQRDRDAAKARADDFAALVRTWQVPLATATRTTTTATTTTDATSLASALRTSDAQPDKRTRVRARSIRALGIATTHDAASGRDVTRNGNDSHDDAAATTSRRTSATTTGGDADDANGEADVQAQLNAIEERIMAEDLTADEMVALEQQMNELTAELERRKRRRTT